MKHVRLLWGLLILLLFFGAVIMITVQKEKVVSTEGSKTTPQAELLTSEQRRSFAAEQKQAFTAEPLAEGVVELNLTAQKTNLELEGAQPLQIDAWTYNGERPGQEFRIKYGQTIRVNLTNQLDEPTTIHWHGIRTPNSMDGVPDITQKAVEPGETFVYEFTPPDAGTYWFHPHYNTSEQIERGLYAALIVEDEYGSSFTKDETWILDDWAIVNGKFYERFNTPHDLSHDGRWGNVFTVNGETNKSVTWSPGDRVRLRLVNAANARVFKPDFGNLPVTVMAVDGIPVFGSVQLEEVDLAPGNRVDLMIEIPSTVKQKSFDVLDTFTRRTTMLGNISIDDQAVSTPELKWAPQSGVAWGGISAADVDEVIELDARRGGKYGISWMLNDAAFPNSEPLNFERGNFVLIDFQNKSSRLHPMHLHGHFFRVIAIDGQPVDEPFWRDTVLVNPRETVRIALTASELGSWALHCHALEHAAAGMMTVININ